jgi:hypothetical protein
MSICTGRDPQANVLLHSTLSSVRLAMPSICCMEALSALENEQQSRRRFENELNLQIAQLRRNATSSHAQSLLFYLEQSRQENEELNRDIKEQLFQALNQISLKAEIIGLTAESLQQSLNTAWFDKDHTDNLILSCILNHARLYPTESKVFLSGNKRDFGKLEVQETLRNAGVNRYFSSTQTLLNWLESRS